MGPLRKESERYCETKGRRKVENVSVIYPTGSKGRSEKVMEEKTAKAPGVGEQTERDG